MRLSATDEQDLRWFFNEANGDLGGLRSTLGTHLDRIRTGTQHVVARPSDATASMDQAAECALRWRRIESQLRRCEERTRIVLDACYRDRPFVDQPIVEAFGWLAGVVLVVDLAEDGWRASARSWAGYDAARGQAVTDPDVLPIQPKRRRLAGVKEYLRDLCQRARKGERKSVDRLNAAAQLEKVRKQAVKWYLDAKADWSEARAVRKVRPVGAVVDAPSPRRGALLPVPERKRVVWAVREVVDVPEAFSSDSKRRTK